MLSILPFCKVHRFDTGINALAVMFYPLVGALLGVLLWGFYEIATLVFASSHAAMMVLALWVLLTGALHLDGFSDTVDALYVDKARAFEVMKDPHVGAMGMIFTVVLLLIKASALLHVSDISLLIAVVMLARYNAVLLLYNAPYLPAWGMASLAKTEFKKKHLLWATAMVIALLLFVNHGPIMLITSLLVAWLCYRFFMRYYGGFNGDMYGFSIELSEVVLLHCAVVLA